MKRVDMALLFLAAGFFVNSSTFADGNDNRAGRAGGALTIAPNGSLGDLKNFGMGALVPGPEPFAALNPGINDFLERCFVSDEAPECHQGSVQGIAGF